MIKKEWIKMGYKEVNTINTDDIHTLYRMFDSGNVWIVQFNNTQKDEIGKVYLSKEQLKEMFRQ